MEVCGSCGSLSNCTSGSLSNCTSFVYKGGHNILELCSVLAQVWFSKTKLNV